MSERPRKGVELTIRVSAFTHEQAVEALAEVLERVRGDAVHFGEGLGASGSGWGFSVEKRLRPGLTREQYAAEIAAWCEDNET